MFEYYRSKRYESNMKILEILKKYFEKYPDSRFHEALIDLHARNDENYDHQYFDESLQTLIDLENYLIFKQINLEYLKWKYMEIIYMVHLIQLI